MPREKPHRTSPILIKIDGYRSAPDGAKLFENNSARSIELFALVSKSGITISPFRDADGAIIMQRIVFK